MCRDFIYVNNSLTITKFIIKQKRKVSSKTLAEDTKKKKKIKKTTSEKPTKASNTEGETEAATKKKPSKAKTKEKPLKTTANRKPLKAKKALTGRAKYEHNKNLPDSESSSSDEEQKVESEKTKKIRNALRSSCAKAVQKLDKKYSNVREEETTKGKIDNDDETESEMESEGEVDELSKIYGHRFRKGVLELLITTKQHPYKEYVDANACRTDFGDIILEYIAKNVSPTKKKGSKKRKKISNVVTADVVELGNIDPNVEVIIKGKSSENCPGKPAINHDLISDTKKVGKCGMCHDENSSFKEETNVAYWKEGYDLHGILCHVCGGDFTTKKLKPTAKTPAWCCLRRNKGCNVVVCSHCFKDMLKSKNNDSRSKRTRRSTSCV